MTGSLQKLIGIASQPVSRAEAGLPKGILKLAGPLADELLGMLRAKNGFYAFESALHVFPAQSDRNDLGLIEWNDVHLWAQTYQGLADNCLFFAEDVFGGQFCITQGKVSTFDPETGALEYLADSLDGWASALLADYEVLAGYPLAHEWQTRHGPIPSGKRLLPKFPFIAGGEFTIDNLYLQNSVEGMRFRGEFASQIKDLPDGAQIKIQVVD